MGNQKFFIQKNIVDICHKHSIIGNENGICQKLEEVKGMPGKDGTGPIGAGSQTGRGLGICSETVKYGSGMGMGLGLGLACRRGFGRGFGRGFAMNRKSFKIPKCKKNCSKT